MMKLWRNLLFRTKMVLISLMIVLVVVLVISVMMAANSSRLAVESNQQSLGMITEQALTNYTSSMRNAVQNLFSNCAGSGTPVQLYKMRSLSPDSNEYMLAARDLTNIVQFMISYSMPYDGLAVLPDHTDILVYSDPNNGELIAQAQEVFESEEARSNMYGKVMIDCLPDHSLWVIRDVYNPSPLRHVGRIAARIRKDKLISIGEDNLSSQYSFLFFNADGELMNTAGIQTDPELASAGTLLEHPQELLTTSQNRYMVSIARNADWIAIGLQPMTVVDAVKSAVVRNALLALGVGMLLAFGFTMLASQSLTSGIVRLNESLNRIAEGDLDVVVPVDSEDEIGKLTDHFNKTTKGTKELLNRLVQEEANKRQAELMNLEYEYRFLQWQINPHFIYNALETINGLAKLDGNEELCNMILLLSEYFRHNAETMRSLFVTVRQELRSLRQYVEIYRQIYGSRLEVNYLYDSNAGRAYLPTMIVQPLLENALIHGVSAQKEGIITVRADIEGNRLVIRIEDNGPGMEAETIQKILGERNDHPQNKEEKTSLGVRNVLDRLHLLYGGEAELVIESTLGEGTRVRMSMPLSYVPPEAGKRMRISESE